MLDGELLALCVTAASIGTLHTLIGPDHYIPFIAMSKARGWSLTKTTAITAVCGVGHVLSSILVGALGLALGWALSGLEWFEGARGGVAGWLLLGFGVAYMLWGVRRAIRGKVHTHRHRHANGTVHSHAHDHTGDHTHVHDPHELRAGAPGAAASATAVSITPWILFTIFVFGPCEPLIPILMYPAAKASAWGVALVASVFAVCTIATMLACVLVGSFGLSRLRFAPLERYSHALAGLIIAACGAAIQLGL